MKKGTMKQEFDRRVAERVRELIAERNLVEQAAQAKFAKLVNGSRVTPAVSESKREAGKESTHPIQWPKSTILRRGDKGALGLFLPSRPTGRVAQAAWDALAKDGVFASKATRDDMTAYLLKTFPDLTRNAISGAITCSLERGLLTGEVPDA